MLAERMKSELFEPPINMLSADARGEVVRVVTCTESDGFCTDLSCRDRTVWQLELGCGSVDFADLQVAADRPDRRGNIIGPSQLSHSDAESRNGT